MIQNALLIVAAFASLALTHLSGFFYKGEDWQAALVSFLFALACIAPVLMAAWR